MTLTIIVLLISIAYTLALCKAAAHIAHPGWRRHRQRDRKRQMRNLLAVNRTLF